MPAREKNLTISDAAEFPGRSHDPGKKALRAGLAAIGTVAIVAVLWVAVVMNARETEFADNLHKRLEMMAASQAQLMDAMIETAIEQANQVINSELYRLYAAEVDRIGEDVSLLVAEALPSQAEPGGEIALLSAQLPMMQSLLLEFTRITDYRSGRVVNRNGTVFIATDEATKPLRMDQIAMVKRTLQTHQPQFGPLRHSGDGLVLEAFLPIFPPEDSGQENIPVAVLILSRLTGERMKALGSSRLSEKGEKIRLLQKTADGYQEVVPWLPVKLQEVRTSLDLDGTESLPFAVRPLLDREGQAYSLGRRVAGPNWWIVVEADYDISRESLRNQQRATMSIAALLVVVFVVAYGACWAIVIGYQERRDAAHFAALAQEIEKQRQLFDQINSTISDYIVLQDLKGDYLYVNPAFAAAVGLPPGELIGLGSKTVFGDDTARRLEHFDQQVLASGEPVNFQERVYLQSQPHDLQISKSALQDVQGKVTGIVSVLRDVTEFVEDQKRQQQAASKTVEALVRAIELTDPYLAGHSRLMSSLGSEVAKAMNASDMELATVETAANLSQIGKLFVDRELLSKAGALTPEEKLKMQTHVEYASRVLEGIDFGLPVHQAVCQMNESLDGKGYPQGLSGGEIALPARILAVVNSFCAMLEPRSYRSARSVGEIMSILESAGDIYDQRIVAELKKFVTSADGEELLARRS